jgi:hypothetical protein
MALIVRLSEPEPGTQALAEAGVRLISALAGSFPPLGGYPSRFSISEFPLSRFLRLLCRLRFSFRPFRFSGRSPGLLPNPLQGRFRISEFTLG